ncbi:hypothetical protein MKX01_002651, partial [Papaver californicum]
MSDNGDDPSRYPYPPDYFSNPSSPSDPGNSSGYNNPYSTTFDNNSYAEKPNQAIQTFDNNSYAEKPNQAIQTFDNNSYSGNPCWEYAYPNRPIPTFDNNSYQPTASVDPYSSVPNSVMATTSDHNAYSGNTSGYPLQSDPCSNDEIITVHQFDTVHPYD